MLIKIVVIAAASLLLFGCKGYPAQVYAGVDPGVAPSPQEAIFLELPDDASIRERQFALLLKEELLRNGFNLVDDYRQSIWTMSFSIDRDTYTIGTDTRGAAIGVPIFGGSAAVASGHSKTRYVKQTDVIVRLNVLRTTDLEKPKPRLVWEGSITTTLRIFTAAPNATIKTLLDKFGKNYERRLRLDKNYQREVRARMRPQQIVTN